MPKFPEQVRLHETAVQRAAEGQLTLRGKRGPAKKTDLWTWSPRDLHPLVRAELEKRGPLVVRNIQVKSPTDVVVWNHPAPWPGREA